MVRLVDLDIVAEGPAACVRLNAKARREWDALRRAGGGLAIKQRTQLDRYILEFCTNDHPRANDQHFKKEGNFDDGLGGKAAVFAFKPWQWRLYGVLVSVAGKKCFVATEVDPSKKTNKADQATLRRAASILSEFEDYRSGKEDEDESEQKRDGKHRKDVGTRNHQRRKSRD